MGTIANPDASNIAGAAAAVNVIGVAGAATVSDITGDVVHASPPISASSSRPVAVSSDIALNMDQPPPYTERIHRQPATQGSGSGQAPIRQTTSQNSRSGQASGHSRRRSTRLAVASSAARARHVGSACCPIIID